MFIVVENNSYAQSTPIKNNFAGSFRGRFEGFGIGYSEITSNDVCKINELSSGIISQIKKTKKPHCLLVNTYRLSPHSKGDDDRSMEEIDKWKKKDPLKIAEKLISRSEIDRINFEVEQKILNCRERA